MHGENLCTTDVGVICRIFVKSPKPQNPPKNGCRRATPTTQPVRQPTKSQKFSKPSQYVMSMIYTYPLLTQVSQISTYRVQYMHQIKKKEPHGPPWVEGGLYSDVTLPVLGSTWQKSHVPLKHKRCGHGRAASGSGAVSGLDFSENLKGWSCTSLLPTETYGW